MVPFEGGHIPAVMLDGDPHVVLKPVAESLGLAWTRQLAKLRADSSSCVTLVVTQLPGDDRSRQVIVVSLDTFVVWLAGLQPGRVAEHARAAVVLWKGKAGRALREHFFGPRSTSPALPTDYLSALEHLVAKERERKALEARNAELEPAARSWTVLADAVGDYSLRDAAQILDRDPAIETGQNRLLGSLHDLGWVDGKGIPYQKQVDQGRLVARTTTYAHPHTGEPTLAKPQVRITPKGLQELHKLLGGGAPCPSA